MNNYRDQLQNKYKNKNVGCGKIIWTDVAEYSFAKPMDSVFDDTFAYFLGSDT
jgi:hypothetical protein